MESFVVSIKSALGDPIYFKVPSTDITVDAAICKAIEGLKAEGKHLESTQLESLYKTHVMYNGNEIRKGDLLSSLKAENKTIQNQDVKIFEIELIASHSGGN
jgi:hypothetical protein